MHLCLICIFSYWYYIYLDEDIIAWHSRSFLASSDDEAVSQCGVHGEHRARMSFGHNSY